MAEIQDIRKFMDIWKQKTYREGLDYCFAVKSDKKVFDICVEVIQMQGLTDKYMDGYSVERIPIKDEGGTNVLFSNIFWDLVETYITPAIYVASIVDACIKKGNMSIREIAGMAGRGLRAFPSFLRELDLAYKFSNLIPDAQIITGPEQDVGAHTDILIKKGKNDYKVWSYQNTERALNNLVRKFGGFRGGIPRGCHLFCPIDIYYDSQVEEINGWRFYSNKYAKYLVDIIEMEKPDKYTDLIVFKESALKIHLKKANTIWR